MKNFRFFKIILNITILLLAQNTYALTHYVAKPVESKWSLTQDNPLECKLVHNIPMFGQAELRASAGKQVTIGIMLNGYLVNGSSENVSLVSSPPFWKTGESSQSLANIKFFKQFNGYIEGKLAWILLHELSIGRYPTFTYNNWYENNQAIQVSLSAVNFKNSNLAFRQCIGRLLPYSFADIEFNVLHYKENGDELTAASKRQLDQIAQYIRYTNDIDVVMLSTYTDSYGDKAANLALSEKRAESLAKYFDTLGIEDSKIHIQAYGESHPISPNANPIGRENNRRVVISIQ